MKILRPNTRIEGFFTPFEGDIVQAFPQRRTFHAGELLYGLTNKGNPNFHYFLSGSARYLSMSENGSIQTWSIHGPGMIFPLFHNYDGAETEGIAAVVADCDLETVVMPRAEFHDFLLSRPAMVDAMFDAWMFWSSSALYRMEMWNAPLRERVCGYLLLNRDDNDVVVATHDAIAQSVGASRENVSRAMRQLQDQGSIEQGRGRVRIVSTAALTESIDYAYAFFRNLSE